MSSIYRYSTQKTTVHKRNFDSEEAVGGGRNFILYQNIVSSEMLLLETEILNLPLSKYTK